MLCIIFPIVLNRSVYGVFWTPNKANGDYTAVELDLVFGEGIGSSEFAGTEGLYYCCLNE